MMCIVAEPLWKLKIRDKSLAFSFGKTTDQDTSPSDYMKYGLSYHWD